MYTVQDTKKEDAQLVTSWLLDDPEVLETFYLDGKKEVSQWSQGIVEYRNEQSALTLYKDKTPCGLAALFTTDYIKLKHHALLILIVEKKERRQGGGSFLLDKLIERAHSKQIEHIDLELYDSPYASFFEKRGFTSYATQLRFVKTDKGYRARTLYRRVL